MGIVLGIVALTSCADRGGTDALLAPVGEPSFSVTAANAPFAVDTLGVLPRGTRNLEFFATLDFRFDGAFSINVVPPGSMGLAQTIRIFDRSLTQIGSIEIQDPTGISTSLPTEHTWLPDGELIVPLTNLNAIAIVAANGVTSFELSRFNGGDKPFGNPVNATLTPAGTIITFSNGGNFPFLERSADGTYREFGNIGFSNDCPVCPAESYAFVAPTNDRLVMFTNDANGANKGIWTLDRGDDAAQLCFRSPSRTFPLRRRSRSRQGMDQHGPLETSSLPSLGAFS